MQTKTSKGLLACIESLHSGVPANQIDDSISFRPERPDATDSAAHEMKLVQNGTAKGKKVLPYVSVVIGAPWASPLPRQDPFPRPQKPTLLGSMRSLAPIESGSLTQEREKRISLSDCGRLGWEFGCVKKEITQIA